MRTTVALSHGNQLRCLRRRESGDAYDVAAGLSSGRHRIGDIGNIVVVRPDLTLPTGHPASPGRSVVGQTASSACVRRSIDVAAERPTVNTRLWALVGA